MTGFVLNPKGRLAGRSHRWIRKQEFHNVRNEEQKDLRIFLNEPYVWLVSSHVGRFFGILAFQRDTITNQSYKIPRSAIAFKVLLFSRKIEKMFRDFYKRHTIVQPHARRDRVLLEFSQRLGKPAPTKVVAGWGVGGRQDRGGREGREEPGREDRQQAFVLASSSASAEIGPSNCTS